MKILTPLNIFNKTIYFAQKSQSVLDIALLFETTPQFIILDNNLTCEPDPFDALVINRYGKSFVVSCEYLESLTKEDIEHLKIKNKVEYLFVGQLIIE